MPTTTIKLPTGLVVTNIRPRADSTGSFDEYSDATVSRAPTAVERKTLMEEYKILGLDFAFLKSCNV